MVHVLLESVFQVFLEGSKNSRKKSLAHKEDPLILKLSESFNSEEFRSFDSEASFNSAAEGLFAPL